MSKFIKSNAFYPNILILFYRMNQSQPLSISVDFQGYLVCQIPEGALEVELKIKTKWGTFTFHTDQFTRTEKYRAWRKANRCKINSRRRRCLSDSHLNISSDSSTFINQGQTLTKNFPCIFPYYRTTAEHAWLKRSDVLASPHPYWSGETHRHHTSQPLQTWTITKTGKTYRTTSFHQIGQTKTTSGLVKPTTKLGPNQH